MNFLFLCEAVQSRPLFLKQRLLDPVGRDGDGYYWLTGRVDDVINVRCVFIEIFMLIFLLNFFSIVGNLCHAF